MSKAAMFTMKLEPDLRAASMAAVEETHRPASQVVRELMREFVQRQQDRPWRVPARQGRSGPQLGLKGQGRTNEEVEAEFAARRARITDRA